MTLKIGWLHEAEQSLGTRLHEADDWQESNPPNVIAQSSDGLNSLRNRLTGLGGDLTHHRSRI